VITSSVPVLTLADADEDDSLTKFEGQAEAMTTLTSYTKAVPAGFFQYFANTWVLAIRAMKMEYPDVVKLVSIVWEM
jgi:hypothetical protein